MRITGDPTPRVTNYNYDPSGNGSGYIRVNALPTKVTSPSGKVVNTSYDENLRIVNVTAIGDANVPNAITSYTYDANGNVLTVKDPNGQSTGAVTTYTYNVMNQVKSITDTVSADRNANGHTMDYAYDILGHLTKQTRADNATFTFNYFTNGWLEQKVGFGGDKIQYVSYQAITGQPTSVDYFKADGTSFRYSYTYDALGRLVSTKYPADVGGVQRMETYLYDVANHLYQYTNQAGQVKTLTYDNRGRLTNAAWNANGRSVTIAYDPTRPTSISTSDGTTIAYGYDEANNKIYEDQTITGLPTRRVQTDVDADGNRTDLLIKTGGTINSASYFDYTSRNELLNIYDSNRSPFFKYSYDASGNVTAFRTTATRFHYASL